MLKMSVIQIQAPPDVIKALSDHLQPRTFARWSKKKLLAWMEEKQIIDLYNAFHGEDAKSELKSTVKSIYKGEIDKLPITQKSIAAFRPGAIRLFLNDFLEDIQITSPKLHKKAGKTLESHVRRFKYREMLRKIGIMPNDNVQIALVNQMNAPTPKPRRRRQTKKSPPKPKPFDTMIALMLQQNQQHMAQLLSNSQKDREMFQLLIQKPTDQPPPVVRVSDNPPAVSELEREIQQLRNENAELRSARANPEELQRLRDERDANRERIATLERRAEVERRRAEVGPEELQRLRAELNAGRERIEELERRAEIEPEELQRLRAERDVDRVRIEELEGRADIDPEDLQRLRAERDADRDRIGELEREQQELEAEPAQLRTQITELTSQIERKNQRIQDLEDENDPQATAALEQELEAQVRLIEQLRQRTSQLEGSEERSTRELEQARQRSSNLQDEVAAANRRLESAPTPERIAELQESIRGLTQEKAAADARVEALRRRPTTGQLQAVQAARDEANRLKTIEENAVRRLREQVDRAPKSEDIERLRVQIADLQRRPLQSDVDTLQSRLDQRQADLAQTETRISELQRTIEQLQSEQTESQQLEDLRSELEATRQSLRDRPSQRDLQVLRDRLERTRRELEGRPQQTDVDILETRLRARPTEDQMQAATDALARTEARLAAAPDQADIDLLRSQLESRPTTDDLIEAQEKIVRLQSESAEDSARATAAERELARLRVQQEAAQTKIRELEARPARDPNLTKEIAENRRLLRSRQEKIDKLELDAKLRKREFDERVSEEVRKERLLYEDQVRRRKLQINDLKKQLRRKGNDPALQGRLEQLEKDLSESQSRFGQLEAELERTRQGSRTEIDSLRNRLASAKENERQIQIMSEAGKRLETELAQRPTTEQLIASQANLKQLEDELANLQKTAAELSQRPTTEDLAASQANLKQLESELAAVPALSEQIKQLSARLAQTTEAEQGARAALEQQQETIRQLSTRPTTSAVEDLRKRLAEVEQSAAQLSQRPTQADLDELKTQLQSRPSLLAFEAKKTALQKAEQARDDRQAKIEALQQQQITDREAIQRLEAESATDATLQKQLEENKTAIREREAEIERLREQASAQQQTLTSAMSELNVNKNKLKNLEFSARATEAGLRQEGAKILAERNQLQNEIKEKYNKLTELRNEFDELQRDRLTVRQSEKLRARLARAQRSTEESQAALAKLQAEAQRSEQLANQYSALEEQLKKTRSEGSAAVQNAERLQKLLETANAELGSIDREEPSRLKRKLEDLRKAAEIQVRQAGEKADSLQKSLDDINRQKTNLEKRGEFIEKERVKFKERAEQAENRLDDLRTRTQQAERIAGTAKKTFAEQRIRIKKLEQLRNKLRGQLAEARERGRLNDANLEKTRQTIANRVQELEESQAQLQALREELASERTNVQQLEEQGSAGARQVRELQQQLEERDSAGAQQAQAFRQQIQQLEEQARRAEEQGSAGAQQVRDLRQQLEEQASVRTAAERRLLELEDEQRQQGNVRAAAERRLLELEEAQRNRVQELKSESAMASDDLRKRIEALETTAEARKKTTGNLSRELLDQQKQRQELQQKLSEAEQIAQKQQQEISEFRELDRLVGLGARQVEALNLPDGGVVRIYQLADGKLSTLGRDFPNRAELVKALEQEFKFEGNIGEQLYNRLPSRKRSAPTPDQFAAPKRKKVGDVRSLPAPLRRLKIADYVSPRSNTEALMLRDMSKNLGRQGIPPEEVIETMNYLQDSPHHTLPKFNYQAATSQGKRLSDAWELQAEDAIQALKNYPQFLNLYTTSPRDRNILSVPLAVIERVLKNGITQQEVQELTKNRAQIDNVLRQSVTDTRATKQIKNMMNYIISGGSDRIRPEAEVVPDDIVNTRIPGEVILATIQGMQNAEIAGQNTREKSTAIFAVASMANSGQYDIRKLRTLAVQGYKASLQGLIQMLEQTQPGGSLRAGLKIKKKLSLDHTSLQKIKSNLKKEKPKSRAKALKVYTAAHKAQPREDFKAIIEHIQDLERKRKVGFRSRVKRLFI